MEKKILPPNTFIECKNAIDYKLIKEATGISKSLGYDSFYKYVFINDNHSLTMCKDEYFEATNITPNIITPSAAIALLKGEQEKKSDGFIHECIEGFQANGKELLTKGNFYPVTIAGIFHDNYGSPRRADFFFRSRHFKLIKEGEQEKGEKISAKEFCENYDSKAKHLLQGVNDPLLHAMMQDFANQQTSKLQQELKEAREALQELVDLQNGAPLEQHKAEWEQTMEKCYSVLNK